MAELAQQLEYIRIMVERGRNILEIVDNDRRSLLIFLTDESGKVVLVYEDVLYQTHLLEGGAQLEEAAVVIGLEPVDEDLRFPHLLLQGGAGQLVHH